MQQLSIITSDRMEFVEITSKIQEMVQENGWQEGALVLWCPHTTGAVTVNENADSSVIRDILVNTAKLVPHQGDYKHAEGNSDAHIKSSLVGASLTCIVSGGKLQLGTWQGLFFCEFDGPRNRKLLVQYLPAG
jgi:secondary thiamine-phosphate synthase enzyme